jgi:hypothetical protein
MSVELAFLLTIVAAFTAIISILHAVAAKKWPRTKGKGEHLPRLGQSDLERPDNESPTAEMLEHSMDIAIGETSETV